MKPRLPFIMIASLLLFSASCCFLSGLMDKVVSSAESKVVGGGNVTTASSMWPDVPVMDGMKKGDISLPLPAKLAIQAYLNANGKSGGAMDFISFTTDQTPEAVTAFYTVDKMKAAGWNDTDTPGCVSGQGQDSSASSGGICFFAKKTADSNKGTLLAIFVTKENQTGATQVFFMRVDGTNLGTSTNP